MTPHWHHRLSARAEAALGFLFLLSAGLVVAAVVIVWWAIWS